MARVLVCGGRDAKDERMVWRELDYFHGQYAFSCLIEGGARGIDTMAHRWATANHVPTVRFEADWKTHGKAAGPIRNRRMLDEGKPTLVLAFPGGRGTADMVRQADARGVTVIDVAHCEKEPA